MVAQTSYLPLKQLQPKQVHITCSVCARDILGNHKIWMSRLLIKDEVSLKDSKFETKITTTIDVFKKSNSLSIEILFFDRFIITQ